MKGQSSASVCVRNKLSKHQPGQSCEKCYLTLYTLCVILPLETALSKKRLGNDKRFRRGGVYERRARSCI